MHRVIPILLCTFFFRSTRNWTAWECYWRIHKGSGLPSWRKQPKRSLRQDKFDPKSVTLSPLNFALFLSFENHNSVKHYDVSWLILQERVFGVLYDVVTSDKFEIAILSVIMCNMVLMTIQHHGQSPEISSVLNILCITKLGRSSKMQLSFCCYFFFLIFLRKVFLQFFYWVTMWKMRHIWKNGSNCEKWVILGKIEHTVKFLTHFKMWPFSTVWPIFHTVTKCHIWKNGSRCKKWVTLWKWSALQKRVTLGKMGDAVKNGSHWKMGHTLTRGSHLEKFLTL